MKNAVIASALLASIAATSVRAEEPIEPGPDVDAGLRPGVPRPLWELGVGVAGLRVSDYRGSDHKSNYVLPLPYFVYRGAWLQAGRDGARAMLFEQGRVKVDLSLGASTPTHSKDDPARVGMPNLSATGEIGPNLNITLASSTSKHYRLDLRLPVRAAFTIERSPRSIGATFSPNLNLDLGGVAPGWNLGMQTGPVFADRRYHSYIYGVDPQYATSTRPAYQARGGYGGWQASAASSRRFGNAWVGAFLRYDNLRGAAFDDSPLVRQRSALTLGFGISWVLTTSSTMVTSAD
jgi:outer membrane scaffolding protein for murein synthesis (MipA/OmpV family)